MKRILAVASLTIVLALATAAPAHADVDDFSFASFDATYELSADQDGRSVLHTTETLVAEFPEIDQNHGIRRELVDEYQGHPTNLEVESVTDENGNPREYELTHDAEFVILRISGDAYLHGEQTYVITYVQHNVTLFTDNVEELYWDTNGTGWAQLFRQVSATVIIDPALRPALTGAVATAYGYAGENTGEAVTTPTSTGYRFDVANVFPGKNLTFAIGFEPGTFTPRADGLLDSPWGIATLVLFILTLLALGGVIVVRRTYLADAPGRGIIIAQYVAPKVPLGLSATVLKAPKKAAPAQVISLAISGNLRLRETRINVTSYDIQFVTFDGADAAERVFLETLFGMHPAPGTLRHLNRLDPHVMAGLARIRAYWANIALTTNYFRKPSRGMRVLLTLPTIVLALLTMFIAFATLGMGFGGPLPVLMLLVSLGAAVAAIAILAKVPMGPPGVELRDYLAGLKLYITLAEQDRLRYLQSPSGAVKVPIDTNDRVAIVKLYEKLLPYAVLFGNEKEWAAVLGRFYDESGGQPDWYTGTSAFNVAYFALAVDSVAASSSSGFSSSSFSDSGGGSDGGGGSGDGGGGGGGGGD